MDRVLIAAKLPLKLFFTISSFALFINNTLMPSIHLCVRGVCNGKTYRRRGKQGLQARIINNTSFYKILFIFLLDKNRKIYLAKMLFLIINNNLMIIFVYISNNFILYINNNNFHIHFIILNIHFIIL